MSISTESMQNLIAEYGETAIYNALYKELGYAEPVPTIDEFIESDEYLGRVTANGTNVYAYWRKQLREVYPTPFTTPYHSIMLRGSIGIGKSVIAKIMAAYNLMKMMKLRDPRTKFNMLPTTTFELFGYAASLDLVSSVFEREFVDWLNLSPFFKNKMELKSREHMFKNRITLSKGTTVTHNVGRAIFTSVFEEIQREIRHDQLRENYFSILQRLESRFKTDEGLFGQIIMVGSAGASESFAEILTEKSKEDPGILIVDPAQWEVLANDENGKGGKRTYGKERFKIFIGDDTRDPFIIQPDMNEKYISSLNQDLVLEVPMEYYHNFDSDIYQAIQDIAGISTRAQFRFFQSMAKITPSMSQPNWFNQDVIQVSFYDKNDKIIDKINKDVFLSRKGNADLHRFIHIDIGYASDNTGITCVHISGTERIDRSNLITNTVQKLREPKYTVDFSVGIGRLPGEETPIYKLREFIFDLAAMNIPIACVSCDGFQSKQLLQELKVAGFSTQYVSVDRTIDPYQTLKLAMFEGRVTGVKNELLKTELSKLQLFNGTKVDHPPEGSKDIADSLAGAIKLAQLHQDRYIYANSLDDINEDDLRRELFLESGSNDKYQSMDYQIWQEMKLYGF